MSVNYTSVVGVGFMEDEIGYSSLINFNQDQTLHILVIAVISASSILI